MSLKHWISSIATPAVLLCAITAHAAPISTWVSSIGSAANQSGPAASRDDFLSMLEPGYVTEGFDTLAAGSRHGQATTSVGTFTQEIAGVGGACTTLPGGCDGGLAVLDASTSPYRDRYAISQSNWLDNAGTRLLRIDPLAGTNAIGFFATDLGDNLLNIEFSIETASGVFNLGNVFEDLLPNAGLRYIAFAADEDIQSLWINTNHDQEGYGIDDVTVGRLAGLGLPTIASFSITTEAPAPGSLALMAFGALGIVALRRRRG